MIIERLAELSCSLRLWKSGYYFWTLLTRPATMQFYRRWTKMSCSFLLFQVKILHKTPIANILPKQNRLLQKNPQSQPPHGGYLCWPHIYIILCWPHKYPSTHGGYLCWPEGKKKIFLAIACALNSTSEGARGFTSSFLHMGGHGVWYLLLLSVSMSGKLQD